MLNKVKSLIKPNTEDKKIKFKDLERGVIESFQEIDKLKEEIDALNIEYEKQHKISKIAISISIGSVIINIILVGALIFHIIK